MKHLISLKVCFEARHSLHCPQKDPRGSQIPCESEVHGCSWSPKSAAAFSKGFSQWIHMRIDVLAPPAAWCTACVSQHGASCCSVQGCGGDLCAWWLWAHDSACLSDSPCQIECHPLDSMLHNVFFTSVMCSVKLLLWAWADTNTAWIFLTYFPKPNLCRVP